MPFLDWSLPLPGLSLTFPIPVAALTLTFLLPPQIPDPPFAYSAGFPSTDTPLQSLPFLAEPPANAGPRRFRVRQQPGGSHAHLLRRQLQRLLHLPGQVPHIVSDPSHGQPETTVLVQSWSQSASTSGLSQRRRTVQPAAAPPAVIQCVLRCLPARVE